MLLRLQTGAGPHTCCCAARFDRPCCCLAGTRVGYRRTGCCWRAGDNNSCGSPVWYQGWWLSLLWGGAVGVHAAVGRFALAPNTMRCKGQSVDTTRGTRRVLAACDQACLRVRTVFGLWKAVQQAVQHTAEARCRVVRAHPLCWRAWGDGWQGWREGFLLVFRGMFWVVCGLCLPCSCKCERPPSSCSVRVSLSAGECLAACVACTAEGHCRPLAPHNTAQHMV